MIWARNIQKFSLHYYHLQHKMDSKLLVDVFWLATGHSSGAQSTSVQSVSHSPQHSPGGMMGLGQEGLGQSVTLQSCLHVLQQSHLTMGSGQKSVWTRLG